MLGTFVTSLEIHSCYDCTKYSINGTTRRAPDDTPSTSSQQSKGATLPPTRRDDTARALHIGLSRTQSDTVRSHTLKRRGGISPGESGFSASFSPRDFPGFALGCFASLMHRFVIAPSARVQRPGPLLIIFVVVVIVAKQLLRARIEGVGLRNQGLGFRVWDSGFVLGFRIWVFRVWGRPLSARGGINQWPVSLPEIMV